MRELRRPRACSAWSARRQLASWRLSRAMACSAACSSPWGSPAASLVWPTRPSRLAVADPCLAECLVCVGDALPEAREGALGVLLGPDRLDQLIARRTGVVQGEVGDQLACSRALDRLREARRSSAGRAPGQTARAARAAPGSVRGAARWPARSRRAVPARCRGAARASWSSCLRMRRSGTAAAAGWAAGFGYHSFGEGGEPLLAARSDRARDPIEQPVRGA